MTNSRKRRKYGIWLHNHVDERDDEWTFVYARNAAEAERRAEFDHSRFSLGDVMPVKKFRQYYGLKGL